MAIAKESAALRQALANWLEEKYYQKPNEGIWDFVQTETFLTIPGLMDLVLSDKDASSSPFLAAFENRKNENEDILISFLIPVTLDNNASLPIETLNLYDQLIAYGFLMVDMADESDYLKICRNKIRQDHRSSRFR